MLEGIHIYFLSNLPGMMKGRMKGKKFFVD